MSYQWKDLGVTCEHPDTWFDRVICADPCGRQHSYCTDCGERMEGCEVTEAQLELARFLPHVCSVSHVYAVVFIDEQRGRVSICSVWASQEAAEQEAASIYEEVSDKLTRREYYMALKYEVQK